MFCNNTTYFITAKNSEILSHLEQCLNTKLMDWYYKTLSVQLGENAVRMFSIYVLNIPIPDISDIPLASLYGLSESEIKYIENLS